MGVIVLDDLIAQARPNDDSGYHFNVPEWCARFFANLETLVQSRVKDPVNKRDRSLLLGVSDYILSHNLITNPESIPRALRLLKRAGSDPEAMAKKLLIAGSRDSADNKSVVSHYWAVHDYLSIFPKIENDILQIDPEVHRLLYRDIASTFTPKVLLAAIHDQYDIPKRHYIHVGGGWSIPIYAFPYRGGAYMGLQCRFTELLSCASLDSEGVKQFRDAFKTLNDYNLSAIGNVESVLQMIRTYAGSSTLDPGYAEVDNAVAKFKRDVLSICDDANQRIDNFEKANTAILFPHRPTLFSALATYIRRVFA
jgi:hypothetical protein